MKLDVNEIFVSIQGEGYWTGLPAIFLRLQGCNLNPPCAYCDTPNALALDAMRPMALVGVMTTLLDLDVATVVVTGGEPMIQRHTLAQLIELDQHRHIWHLETNGTLPIPNCFDWVTASPKPMRDLDSSVLRLADEIKIIVTGPMDIQHAKNFYSDRIRYDKLKRIWLQPVRNDPEMIQLCIDTLANVNDPLQMFGLSVQVHKLIGVE